MADQPPLTRAYILNIVLTYAAVASLWILLSDKAVEWLFSTQAQFALASTIKGWLFILITALMLYAMLRRRIDMPVVNRQFSRRQLLPLILINGLILGLTGMAIAQSLGHTQDKEIARIEAIADLKSKQITEWLNARERDARLLIESPLYANLYRQGQVAHPADGHTPLMTRLAEFISIRGFSAATVFSPAGTALWQTPGASGLGTPLREALAQVEAGNVMRVGPYLDEQGQPRLDFIAPLSMPGSGAPLVVLQISSSDWLNHILKQWPIPASSGEALLFRKHGNQVQFLNDVRYRPHSALTLQIPIDNKTLLAAQFLNGGAKEGLRQTFFGQDYRGVEVFGTIHSVIGTDWYLIAKIDKTELNHAAFRESIWIGLIGMLVLFIANAGIILLRQHTQLFMAEQIRQSQAGRLQALQLLSAIADSSEDAIFAKDMEGKYILFNRAASQFVGKPAADMLGQDDMAIFPPDQARMLMDLGQQVIARNKVQTQEEYLTLPSGDRVFLATKGPLQDNEGQVIGIFGISRDITDFKRAEAGLKEREGLFRALVEQSLAGIYILQQGQLCYINPGFARLFGYSSTNSLLKVGTLHALASPKDSDRVAEQLLRCEQEDTEIHTRFTALHHDHQNIEVELYGRRVDYRGQPAVLGLLLDVTEREQVEQALTRQATELRQQNSELERFNKVMVDRELAMLTLKHQINALSLQLGQQPPYPQAPTPPEESQ
ncbi:MULTISPECIES: PAS domain-containing protein [Aeromonas]|uniref:PAS domain S-box protein n=1 Tax=Aeromonas bestiarum TaxID=105751 RepID=A0ABT7PZ11_9GAMM|nr:PAS domain S-box protein [Aeromonas bestiarum]MDM5072099.1 PAS domain S-box protein [Aeromonas bestiarum]